MSQRMTKEMAQEWMAGWRAVEERQREELRKESFEEKFRALAFLMASADLFDTSLLDAEDVTARERWARLQSSMLGPGKLLSPYTFRITAPTLEIALK